MAITLLQPIVFGDTPGSMSGHAHAGAQTVFVNSNPGSQTFVGDASTLLRYAIGGNDVLSSGGMAPNILIGDAITMSGRSRGGDDDVHANSEPPPTALGDAVTMSSGARGGNDTVYAVGGRFGPDGGPAYGDAETMSDRAKGGNDVVTGGIMYGDAQTLKGLAAGGNDTLIAFDAPLPQISSLMYGDGAELLGRARGGNDTLITGEGSNDRMWGDAAMVSPTAKLGADMFSFSPHNGRDAIEDFTPGQDHIQLVDFGFTGFNDVASLIQYTPDGALITFDTVSYYNNPLHDSILVAGINQLGAGDFILA